MRSTEITTGRSFVLALDHGEDFFAGLAQFCAERNIRSGFIPSFVGGFSSARLVGTCKPMENPEAPFGTRSRSRLSKHWEAAPSLGTPSRTAWPPTSMWPPG